MTLALILLPVLILGASEARAEDLGNLSANPFLFESTAKVIETGLHLVCSKLGS